MKLKPTITFSSLLLTLQPKQKEKKKTLHSSSMSSSSLSLRSLKLSLPNNFNGTWHAHEHACLTVKVSPSPRLAKPLRSSPRMGNVNEGKGLFAPLVVLTRNIVGKKRFNQLRGKAIALHSQVITEFCKSIGADSKVRQGLIRIAKKNGERLGFLA